jgi:hypothetical protein
MTWIKMFWNLAKLKKILLKIISFVVYDIVSHLYLFKMFCTSAL